MALTQQTQPAAPAMPHNLTMENRRNLVATGVTGIVSYDEYTAVLDTPLGRLQIGGEGLSVSELSVQSGQVRIAGSIEYIQYSQKQEKKAGLRARLLR